MFIKVFILTVLFYAPDTGTLGIGASQSYMYPNEKSCQIMAGYWVRQYKVQGTHCTISYQLVK